MIDTYTEPTSYAWQLEQDRLDREWEQQDLPDTYPPSPMSRTPQPALTPAGPGPDEQPVVDLEFLSRLGYLPASKLKENR